MFSNFIMLNLVPICKGIMVLLGTCEYHEAVKFCPIFICVCCHCCLFKQNVKVFTKKLKEKIEQTVLDASCIFAEKFMDPLVEWKFLCLSHLL